MNKRLKLFAFVLVAIVAAIPFLPCRNYGIVNCDDYDYVTKKQVVTSGLSAASIKWALTNVDEAIWMPGTWVSYMIDHSIAAHLNRKNPLDASFRIMHIHSVLLHALNAGLLFWLLFNLLDSGSVSLSKNRIIPIAILGAVFWAIHPLRVESVVWVASRKDVLSLFWELCALVCWPRIPRGLKVGYPFQVLFALSVACLVLGGMAKPSVMTFPILVILLDCFILKKFKPWWCYVCLAPIAVGIGTLAAYAQNAGGATSALSAVPLWGRILNAAAAFGMYLKNTVYPCELAVQCAHRWPALPRFAVPGALISLATVTWLFLEAKNFYAKFKYDLAQKKLALPTFPLAKGWTLAGALWFCFAVGPFLGIANFGLHAFADRFTYIPSIGISILLAGVLFVCLPRIEKKAQNLAHVVYTCVLVVLLLLGMQTWRQTRFWENDRTLWERTLAVDGDKNIEAHISLALYHFEFGHDKERVLHHMRKAWQITPETAARAGLCYIATLCELNLVDELKERIIEFGKFSRKLALDTVGHGDTLDYGVAYALYLSAMPSGMDQAKEQIKNLLERFPQTPSVLYAAGRIAQRADESEKARQYWTRLGALNKRTDYVRYRFTSQEL